MAIKFNWDQVPARDKEASDGEKVKPHGSSCGGRCCVHYCEDEWYQVACENCGTIVVYKAASFDLAVKIWNDMPDAAGMR